MLSELFSIGPLTVYSYGLLIAIGVIVGYQIVQVRAKRLNIDITYLDHLALWILGFGFIGAKVLYWLTQVDAIIQNPSIMFNITDGYVVYGGIIGGIIGGYFGCKRKNLNFLEFLDLVVPSVAIAQAFGRIGCFMAGCCYGMEIHGPLGVVFPTGSLAPSGVSLLPTQLISSVFDFALFFILIFYAKRKKANGQVGVLYLMLYSIGRFIIEFFRGDLIRGSVGTLSTSQFISIFMFLFAIGLFIYLHKKKDTTKGM